jgi:hypothetical protein
VAPTGQQRVKGHVGPRRPDQVAPAHDGTRTGGQRRENPEPRRVSDAWPSSPVIAWATGSSRSAPSMLAASVPERRMSARRRATTSSK